MPNIATTLKAEISRVARKEIRCETDSLAKSTRQQRTEMAALKKRVLELERLVHRLAKTQPARPAPTPAKDAELLRFTPKGLASHRKRLGLSADELGRMVGASGQTIYNWESGAARPRASFMPAIAALRRIGKKQARSVVDGLTAAA